LSRDLPLSTLNRDELAELRATVRAVATEAGYPAGVRALEGSPTGIDADLWRVLAEEIGLAAIGLPDEVGGLGGLAEVLAIAEELGSSLAPVPFLSTTVLCGQILAGAGEAVFDPDQLKQAVDNLLRNAIDATPDGGRVRLQARRDGPDHVIEVIDEGPGIPADIVPKIFDLYFTTKADGTGVGLAVTHQIVEAHRGRIDVESSPGAGTRMALRIPAEQGASDRG